MNEERTAEGVRGREITLDIQKRHSYVGDLSRTGTS